MKKQFYLFHRWLGVAACAVMLAWSLTGFLHPIMSWTQPRPVQMFYKQMPLGATQFQTALPDALRQNKIEKFRSLHIVSLGETVYYQLEVEPNAPLVYLDAQTGEKLENGDVKFAEHLARYFTGEKTAGVTVVNRLTKFSGEYKSNNRLLPVYEVKFDRADALTAYVETSASRIATINNSRKLVLQSLFVNLHNFELFGLLNSWRVAVIVFLMLLVFLTALSGLTVYGLMWRAFSKQKTVNARGFLRKYHRVIGLAVSVFALAWSGSGMFHAVAKAPREQPPNFTLNETFTADDFPVPISNVIATQTAPLRTLSIVRVAGETFYRLSLENAETNFVNANNGDVLANGEQKYARFLASGFAGLPESDIASIRTVTKFDSDYGFLNKRLPVMRVQFNASGDPTYFVETASGKLAAKVTNLNRIEDYSFDYLHKGHPFDFLGKIPRDILLMLFAFTNAVVAALGLVLFILGRSGKRLS